jgi:hypothetical protein
MYHNSQGAILLREDCKSILDAQNLGFFYQQLVAIHAQRASQLISL